MTRHTYYMAVTWANGKGFEKHWSESIRSVIIAYSNAMKAHPDAIGTIVGLRIRLK